MSEKGTPEFYREEAERLVELSRSIIDSAIRLEMLRVAESYRTLADHASRSLGSGDGWQNESG